MFYFSPIRFIFLFFFTFISIIIQQNPSKAHNLLELLFHHKKQEKRLPQIMENQIYQPQRKTIIQKPAQNLKEKNAKRILVIGDFVASAAADALMRFFIDNKDIIIINNTMPNSGLVRTDYYSWKSNIPELIDKNKPEAIIMMIGANDNQPITTAQDIFSTLQPEWLNAYRQRIIEVVEVLHNSGKPWIWVGQPSFENDNLTHKMQIFNTLYKNATLAANGYFIDIWNGFVDKQGEFSFSGYNVNGEIAKLRTADGNNFTLEGKKKLASYLEKKLKVIFDLQAPSHEDMDLIQFTQRPNDIRYQPPMSLDDIAQQNTHLLDKMDLSFIKQSWSPLNGHQKDRADNFSFP
ncbi:SGNH/GDSL hydrolase family protein [Bartonella sp. B30(2025)]